LKQASPRGGPSGGSAIGTLRRLVLCLALVIGAPTALAAPAAPPAGPQPRLFLSPSGEPFRPTAAAPDPFEAWFGQADANHDGAIDKAEFRADAARFFKQLDTNGDGVIDGFEASAYENKVVPELEAEAEGRFPPQPPAENDADHPGGGDRGHGGGRHGPPRRAIARLLDEPEPVTGADFNLDSRITLAEWMQATDRRFDLLDKAKTGRLTREALRNILAGSSKPKR
jgi:hypothetical protein